MNLAQVMHRLTGGGPFWWAKIAVQVAFTVGIALKSPSAWAEAAPAPLPVTPLPITPPKVITKIDPVYPEGEQADARVIVSITVNPDGKIREVRVLQGEEPFASRARDCVRRWTFSPGLRGTQPIATIVRAEVQFDAPRSAPASPAPIAPLAPNPSSNDSKPKVDEVVVRGAFEDVPKTQSMGRAEVRLLPGAFGDPFRAIESLPGVTPIISGIPYFYVRGAPPGDVGYFLDGIRIPYLYHFGLGPAVVHPRLIDKVDLHSGVYPASFGRYAGAIVSSSSTKPSPDFTAEGAIRLVDAGAFAEAPLLDGKMHVLVGGRYSYTAALLSLVAPDTSVDYRDYQARVVYEPTPKDTFTFLTFGAYDFASQVRSSGVKETLFDSQFYRFDLRYDRSIDENSSLSAAVTLGYDQSAFEGAQFAGDLMIGGRASASHRFSEMVEVRGGLDTYVDHFSTGIPDLQDLGDQEYAQQIAIFQSRNDVASGIYADVALRLSKRIELTLGARGDRYESLGNSGTSVDPRVRGRVGIADRTHLLVASGLAHQGPGFVVPIPGIGIAGLRGGLQRTYQSSVGVEHDFEAIGTASLTAFHNHFYNMNDILGASTTRDEATDDVSFTQRANGYAIGLEAAFRRKLSKRVGGFFSYTLSRSVRRDRFGLSPAAYDRTHVLNTGVTFDLGLGWNAGARFVYYTGIPINNQRISYPEFGPNVVTSTAYWRLPAYYRIDARIEKRWKVGARGWVSFIVEGLNVTLNKETVSGKCIEGECRANDPIGPVAVPSLGVEGGF